MAPFTTQIAVQGIKDRVESIFCYADRLYVGTSTGTLHIYALQKDTDGLSGPAVLEESKKGFSRRMIEQLGFVKDVNSLVVLSDSTATLYPLPSLSPATPLAQARGAMSFAVDSSVQYVESTSAPSASGATQSPSVVTYLAVGCRKRIVIYTWRDGQAQEVKELSLPHSPRSMAFPNPQVLVMAYTPSEYAILSISTMTVSEPPPLPIPPPTQPVGMAAIGKGALSGLGGYMTLGLGAKAKPSVSKTNEGEFSLTKENQTVFLDIQGKASREGYEWPGPTEETTYLRPYILSVLPAGSVAIPLPSSHPPSTQTTYYTTPVIQIVSTLSLSPAQMLPFPFVNCSNTTDKQPESSSPRSLRVLSSSGAKSPAFVVATPTERTALAAEGSIIWGLTMKSWGKQVDELVSSGLYSDALTLLATLDAGDLEHKERRVADIRALHAVWLFQNGSYDDAMRIFIELEINPAKVIALYPEPIAGRLSQPREKWIELFGGRSPVQDENPDPEARLSIPPVQTENAADHPVDAARPPSPHGSITGNLSIAETIKATLSDIVPSVPGIGVQKEVISPRAVPEARAKDKSKDFTRSVESLLVFLGDRRPKLSGALASFHITPSKSPELPPLSEVPTLELFELANGSPSTLVPEQLLRFAQVVDTALFKSYLVVRPSLLGSLCRLDNWCDVKEVEEVLKARQKYEELKDLYKGKKMHESALALLKELSAGEDDLLDKVDPTIRYLQKLGPEYLGLIFAWSKWVFDVDPTRALQVFTADEVDLPRMDVANYLAARDQRLSAKYMEFLIHELHDTSSIFHNRLAATYMNVIKEMKLRGDESARTHFHQSLVQFLSSSQDYEPDRLFSNLPNDDLYDARAILLGRMGKHEGALDIYVHRLRDYSAAEEYCKRVYQNEPDTRGVFLTLLRIYLRPATNMGSPSTKGTGDSLLGPALDLISRHSPRLDPEETLQLLPPLVKASDLNIFLQEALRSTKVDDRVTREIWKARGNQLDRKLMALQSRRVRVTDSRICPQCHKRLGNSVIAVHFPRGEVTHYQCREAFAHTLADARVR